MLIMNRYIQLQCYLGTAKSFFQGDRHGDLEEPAGGLFLLEQLTSQVLDLGPVEEPHSSGSDCQGLRASSTSVIALLSASVVARVNTSTRSNSLLFGVLMQAWWAWRWERSKGDQRRGSSPKGSSPSVVSRAGGWPRSCESLAGSGSGWGSGRTLRGRPRRRAAGSVAVSSAGGFTSAATASASGAGANSISLPLPSAGWSAASGSGLDAETALFSADGACSPSGS